MSMKYAFIMRGVPGSGKSTVATYISEALRNEGHRVSVHSTDDLCTVDGEYIWDAELAPARHEQNLSNFIDSLERGDACVICDNTNTKVQYFSSYVKAAEDYGYKVIFVELPHPDPAEAAQNNTHNVPMDVIEKMISEWESSQPAISGFFSYLDSIVKSTLESNRKEVRRWYLLGIVTGVVLFSWISFFNWLILT